MQLTDKEMEVLIHEYTRFNINQADDVETVTYIKNLMKKLLETANAERESLIAENAMMRDALEKVRDLSGDPKERKYDLIWECANKALFTKPRLVEVGRWVEGASEEESDFYPISYCGREGGGTMCYTIQTDTKSVAKRKAIQKGE